MSGMPVPLGLAGGNGASSPTDGQPTISMPTAPAGATGPDRWIWLMTGATR
jgi:hypothetical protein